MKFSALGGLLGRGGAGGGAKAARPASRREVLQLRPLRNPALDWYEEEDRVVLHIHRAQTWKTRLLGVFFPLPEDRRVALDAIGTDVWRMLDGKATLGQIARAVANKYKLSPREAELSVQQFFKELGRRGYVGFAVDAAKAGKAARRATQS